MLPMVFDMIVLLQLMSHCKCPQLGSGIVQEGVLDI